MNLFHQFDEYQDHHFLFERKPTMLLKKGEEKAVHDLQHDMRYFIKFGKAIGLYLTENQTLAKLIHLCPILLLVVTVVDWVGMFCQPSSKGFQSAAAVCGKIGSPQFFTFGTFYYFYIQKNRDTLKRIYERWKELPVIEHDKWLSLFTNLSFGLIMTSAILENICFHFKLFPVFEPPIQNTSSFEVYYIRAHGFWATLVPFTPYHASILLLANKMALYSWNFVDLLATIMCRALTFRFESLCKHRDDLEPSFAIQLYEDLIDLMRLIEKYLSPLLFGSFYMDFYATCMQLHMWMTPSEHKHFLHTIYLLWSFIHLIVRMFLLSYQASRLHESAGSVGAHLNSTPKPCSRLLQKRLSRAEISQKRQLAISGLGCFFITKKFILTLIYVAFSFQIFLMQSDSMKCE